MAISRWNESHIADIVTQFSWYCFFLPLSLQIAFCIYMKLFYRTCLEQLIRGVRVSDIYPLRFLNMAFLEVRKSWIAFAVVQLFLFYSFSFLSFSRKQISFKYLLSVKFWHTSKTQMGQIHPSQRLSWPYPRCSGNIAGNPHFFKLCPV